MNTNETLNKNRNIQKRISKAILDSVNEMKDEGIDVPTVSVSVSDNTLQSFNVKTSFVKVFDEYINNLESKCGLSLAEKGIISTLLNYIDYQNNLLQHPSGTPIKRKDLEAILGLGHTAVDKHIPKLIEKGVLAKSTVKRANQYYLNPYIAYKGNKIDKTLLSMFQHTKF